MIRVADLRRRATQTVVRVFTRLVRRSHEPYAARLDLRRLVASTLLHLAAIAFVLNAWWMGAPRLTPAGTSHGRNVVVTYHPGTVAPPPVRRTVATKRMSRTPVRQPAAPVTATSPVVQGNDALGSGDVSLLYVQAFPREKPDLTAAGVTGDVVVVVQIDDSGHVVKVHARRGMGARIDDLVIATVQHWIFHPASQNGHPVASEHEVRFHFDRRNNPDCGWECFALEE